VLTGDRVLKVPVCPFGTDAICDTLTFRRGSRYRVEADIPSSQPRTPACTPRREASMDDPRETSWWEEMQDCVLQASGMISLQAECTLAEAVGLMRDRSRVQWQTLTEVADAVVAREIRFG
jgi:hypothetical protein